MGDLIFNGTASREDRYTLTGGAELDASYRLTDNHTLRGGYVLLVQHASSQSATDTCSRPMTNGLAGQQRARAPASSTSTRRAKSTAFYLQDEWKDLRAADPQLRRALRPRGRVRSTRARPARASTLVYQLSASEHRSSTPATRVTSRRRRWRSVQARRASTSCAEHGTNAAEITQAMLPTKANAPTISTPARRRRSSGRCNSGLDGYYKHAVQQIDEGQFGTAIIESPFNYRFGDVYGVEGTATYVKGGLEAVCQRSLLGGEGASKIDVVAVPLRDPDELAYINDPQGLSGPRSDRDDCQRELRTSTSRPGTRAYADMLYGSGLRNGFANTGATADVLHVQCRGRAELSPASFRRQAKARFDLVNLTRPRL